MTEARRVLVIEDEFLTAMELATVLEELGHAVCAIVDTEEEAVEAAARQRPDLITADVRLRSGDGIAAVGRITAATPVPVVYVTSSDAELRRRAPSSVQVSKPFDAKSVSRAIAAVLGVPPVAVPPVTRS
ncbi:MAG: response regulator [Thalassobaculum sp.]|uniref:response regulator n=1 Tax=Thalassobaculum sp. TaxID=2022740 RepID=UPI0032EEAD93